MRRASSCIKPDFYNLYMFSNEERDIHRRCECVHFSVLFVTLTHIHKILNSHSEEIWSEPSICCQKILSKRFYFFTYRKSLAMESIENMNGTYTSLSIQDLCVNKDRVKVKNKSDCVHISRLPKKKKKKNVAVQNVLHCCCSRFNLMHILVILATERGTYK